MKLFYRILSILLIFSAFSFVGPGRDAQKFEGEILYKNTSGRNINYTRYFVKGNYIRVENLDRNLEIDSYHIIKLQGNITEIDFVNPHQKIYKHETFTGGVDRAEDQKFIISKTGNSKVINNKECFKWQVTNREKNTKVTYWLAENGVPAFGDIVEVLNSTERTAYYYLEIPESNSRNIFPLEIEEYSLLREKRIKITLKKMQNKKVSNSLFIIPTDYKIID